MVPPTPSKNVLRFAGALLAMVCCGGAAFGGGPAFVAGTAFDPAMSGKPILWAGGSVTYFTDQGDLSPLLLQADANAFVADAFARWSTVSTAALSISRGGSLAEDVNGSNVTVSNTGLNLPADIQPSATNRPIAIVYDLDGQVTDRLLGTGASDPSLCATNSILGGVDKFAPDAHIAHALIVINGRCAQTTGDLPPLKYRLIRAIGRALGVGWSQANDNVQTGTPPANGSDLAGFPLMHPVDPFCTGAITSCIPNADQLRMDDRASISRLYPVTAQNAGNFPGKHLFGATTARISGSIFFPDAHGNAAQPMQGVNVVARLLDPATGIPSKISVVTSVSGFLFRGNAGNKVTGLGATQRFDAFGGGDPAIEGFFDLAGLEIPAGQSNISVQITLEAVNSVYRGDAVVGPYVDGMVTPSGTRPVIVVANLAAGDDVARDIIMPGASTTQPDDSRTNVRRSIPASGDWWGTLSGYGRNEFYRFSGNSGRSFDLQVTTVNEALHPTSNKAHVELGLWTPNDSLAGLAPLHADSFNGLSTGVTDLSATLRMPGTNQLAIVDFRGDGRPDFRYHAHFLYADTVTPSRISSGNILHIKGVGFRSGVSAAIGGNAANVLSVSESSIFLQAPAASDGTKDVVITDPVSGAAVTMTGAVIYGILPDDRVFVSGSNANTLVGTTAVNPLRVRVTASDGVTPISGAAVALAISPTSSQIIACAASSCTLSTDGNGEIQAFIAVKAAGVNTLTASLPGGQVASGTIVGSSSAGLAALTPARRIVMGSSTVQTLTTRLVNAGNGTPGQTITYTLTSGSGALSSGTAVTDASGFAGVNLSITGISSVTVVAACAASLPCVTFSVQPVAASNIQLQKISGDGQMIAVGQTFQPITFRVTDSSTPPNPLNGVTVSVLGSVFANASADCSLEGECHPAMQHPLAGFSATLSSDANGIVTYTPVVQPAWGAVQVGMIATAGANAAQNLTLQVFAPAP